MTYPAIVFDIDRTLTASKEAITPPMAELIAQLSQTTPVALITGDSFTVIDANVLSRLPASTQFDKLYVLPTSGAALYVFTDGSWTSRYALNLDDEEVQHIDDAIREACAETALIDLAAPSYGEIIEHRGPQVTISALGQNAPIALKDAWDPDHFKKRTLRDAIAKRLPNYDVKTGGATSVDVTRAGINKAYGVRALATLLHLEPRDML